MSLILLCFAALIFAVAPMLAVGVVAVALAWNQLFSADYEWLEVLLFWGALLGIAAGVWQQV